LNCPWGENYRAQHGTATLVDPTQPTDLLTVGQRHLVAGVDLPALVGHLGAGQTCAATARWRGGLVLVVPQPAAQGPLGGQRLLGQALAQDAQQEPCAPVRVTLLEVQGAAEHVRSGGEIPGANAAVGRCGDLAAVRAAAL
jgi:hypothetical protein